MNNAVGITDLRIGCDRVRSCDRCRQPRRFSLRIIHLIVGSFSLGVLVTDRYAWRLGSDAMGDVFEFSMYFLTRISLVGIYEVFMLSFKLLRVVCFCLRRY